jgi:hypothetical protein
METAVFLALGFGLLMKLRKDGSWWRFIFWRMGGWRLA